MIVGVPKEAFPGERRVALVPMVVPNLMKAGFQVQVEAGAGASAGYPDAEYVEKGAKLAASGAEVFQSADVIVQVLSYGSNDVTGKDDLALFRRSQTVIGFHRPFGSIESAQQLACSQFLVSTNGKKFHHPNREAIARAIRSCADASLAFNYRTEFTAPWGDTDLQTNEHYTAAFPNNTPSGGIKIMI